jgi:hypothetical protein
MEIPKPLPEHEWLTRLAGEWTFESECVMGPDQPPQKFAGTEVARSLGDLWLIGEWNNDVPEGGCGTSIITLGYDPQQKRFIGTFIAGMMSHLWLYNGTLDEARKVLTLDAEGPSFTGTGMAKYQDILEVVDDNHKVLRSQMQMPDGNWVQFMTAHYYRKK